MIKGYDDDSGQVKIVHWPLKSLWRCRNERRNLRDRAEDGKEPTGYAGIRHPYSTCSANGWNPFKGKYENKGKLKVSRWALVNRRARRLRNP
jgi:hypothetical protein